MLYPMKLKAPLKDYIWGGTKLKEDYGKVTDLPKVSESWELACHKDGMSVIANGPYKDKTLAEYIAERGKRVLGSHNEHCKHFPLLVKLIDAKENLSLQVHPDDAYAQRVEGESGKTEMWYIVECEPGAKLIYGFEQEISREEFAQRIKDNTILEVCHQVPVHPGDVFFIPSGTLHAIGKGMLICEIQQSSNTTYRVYDYNRLGNDGKPRELHIAKALDVTKRAPVAPRPRRNDVTMDIFANAQVKLLETCPFFTVYTLDINGEVHLQVGKESFQSFTVLTGSFSLCDGHINLPLRKGETVFLPADLGDYQLTGHGKIILSKI